MDTHFLVFCPFHYNTNSPACEVDKTKGLFFCFSCGETGKIHDLIMRIKNWSYYQAIRLIKKYESTTDVLDLVENEMKEKKEFEPYDKKIIKRLNEDLKKNQTAKDYIYSRSITDVSIEEFELGYSEKQEMVTVPVHTPNGEYVGFVARSVAGKDFKNTPGLPRNRVIFNYHRVDKTEVAVVESSFDAIRLHQIGIPAVATLGSKISKQQLSLLNEKFSSIIIMSDNDDAGKTLSDSIKKSLSHKVVKEISWPEGIKDVGDLKDNEIKDIYIKAKDILNIMLGEK
jgi:DNA primase